MISVLALIVPRACAEAWAAGGLEGERQERELWETRERRKVQESLDAMTAMKENALKPRQTREDLGKGKNTFCLHKYIYNHVIFISW